MAEWSVPRPDWDTYFLDIAEAVSARATCSRLRVGAVLTIDNRIKSTGYNGAPSGETHCTHEDNEPCLASVHAERNALSGSWFDAYGATLYVTHSPCLKCAHLIITAHVSRVVYRRTYRTYDGINHLYRNGVRAIQQINVEIP